MLFIDCQRKLRNISDTEGNNNITTMCLRAVCARTLALLWCLKSLRTGWMLMTRASYPMIVHQCFDGLLDPPWTSWGQLVPAGASWYNTLKLASCHVHRPCPNPLQSHHRVMTSNVTSRNRSINFSLFLPHV